MLINFFLFNFDKMEMFLLGLRVVSSNFFDYMVILDGFFVLLCVVVKDFGVIIDFSLLFDVYVDNIISMVFFYFSNIFKMSNMLLLYDAEMLVYVFVIFSLDYCNVLLFGCFSSNMNKF